MGLFCTNCRNNVPEGTNQCRICNNGFVHQLKCSTCGEIVERGMAICLRCSGSGAKSDLSLLGGGGDRSLSRFLPPSRGDVTRLRSLERGEHIADAGIFGALSDVTVPEDVSGMLGEISSTIQTVLRLATHLAALAPADRTRGTIRACRELAVILQEELESRRGTLP
jgi:hypothetical protein